MQLALAKGFPFLAEARSAAPSGAAAWRRPTASSEPHRTWPSIWSPGPGRKWGVGWGWGVGGGEVGVGVGRWGMGPAGVGWVWGGVGRWGWGVGVVRRGAVLFV